jgi:DNA-binding NtrC family response regulator
VEDPENWRKPAHLPNTQAKEHNRVKPKILLVDDEDNILEQMQWALEPDYQVFTTASEAQALEAFGHEKPPVVTLDLSLNPQDPGDLGGLRLLKQMLFQEPSTQVIIVTANRDDTNTLRAIQLGAFDYYSKPVRLDEIKITIQRAFHIHHVKQRIRQSFSGVEEGFHEMIAKLASTQDVFRSIDVVAGSGHEPTDVNLKFAKRLLEMEFVKKALSRNRGIVSRAARELGISRVNLYDLIDKHNIRVQEFKMGRSAAKQQVKTEEAV